MYSGWDEHTVNSGQHPGNSGALQGHGNRSGLESILEFKIKFQSIQNSSENKVRRSLINLMHQTRG